jgi:polyhydroxybutyrate depolymerase
MTSRTVNVRHKQGARLILGIAAFAVTVSLLGMTLTAVCDSSAGATKEAVLAPMSGSYVFTLTVHGTHRSYRLHVPPAASSDKPMPLVLNLHGATQSGILQESYSQMDAASDHDGYLVAYPDGTKDTATSPSGQYSWDAGACCGLPVTKHVDDVAFLLDVISDIAARTPVNLRRVYVTGMSAGGMMAYTMAAKASGHIAAIASVSGQVELPSIHPSRAVPTMEFHSVEDPIAKWNGVGGKYSVMDGIDKWVKADGCAPKPHAGATIVGATGSTSAGETATRIAYTGCRDGSQVVLWKLTGSGHVWPGSPLLGTPTTHILTGVGRGTTLINADQLMWQFFKGFSLPTTPQGHRGN